MKMKAKYMQMAAKMALENFSYKDYSLACVAIRNDGVLVKSTNGVVPRTLKTSKKTALPSAHAEIRALKKAGKGAILYVARVWRNGDWALSRPCTTCQAMIKNRGVRIVYYTIGPNEWGTWVL